MSKTYRKWRLKKSEAEFKKIRKGSNLVGTTQYGRNQLEVEPSCRIQERDVAKRNESVENEEGAHDDSRHGGSILRKIALEDMILRFLSTFLGYLNGTSWVFRSGKYVPCGA